MTDSGGTPARRPVWSVLAALVVVIALGAALSWWLRPREVAAPAAGARPAAPAPEPPQPESAAPLPPAERPAARTPKPGPTPAEVAPEAPPPVARPTLHVRSDVDGAFVFVDRKFVGKTPLDVTDVTSGHHQVNVSAEGYEGVSEGVDIGETGTTDLNVSLKTVRLDASVAVVHKHAIGSCEGTLHATPQGLRYDSPNRDDAFVLPFSDVEIFTVEYQQKTLRVKKKGGRTWNFTTHAANADPLLSFQHEVDKARARLAHGGLAR